MGYSFNPFTGNFDQTAIPDPLTVNDLTVNTLLTAAHIHGNIAGSLYVHVKNTSGGPLTKGTPVYAVGAVGDTTTLEVAAADAVNSDKIPAIGLLQETLAHNASGHAVMFGEITGFNTGSYQINDELYLASGGGLTATKPTSGYLQSLAIVGRVHANTGTVLVWVASGTDGIANNVKDGDKGDISISSGTWSIDSGAVTSDKIANGTITDTDISATAEIAVSKLADGAARQLLQTAANGNDVEWTNNVDIPGTLDVTQAATFDSTVSVPLGTAGAPSIYPGSDTNTGVWSPEADSLAVSTNGVERVRVGNTQTKFTNDLNLDDGGSFTTTLQTITPTASRTISLPDATGTVALVAGSSGQILYNNAGVNAGVSTLTVDGSGNLTLSGRLTNGYTSLASAPAKTFTGSWFTGGTATTTKPHFLIEPSGATSTAWSTSGTGLGVNAASGFAGNLLDLQLNGSSQVKVQGTNIYFAGQATGFEYYNNGLLVRPNGTYAAFFNFGELRLLPTLQLSWAASGSTSYGVGPDIGLTRSGANTLKVTNGSTGDGTISGQLRAVGAAPASATAAGTAGDVRYDADYIYICTATNTWKRAALSTW